MTNIVFFFVDKIHEKKINKQTKPMLEKKHIYSKNIFITEI